MGICSAKAQSMPVALIITVTVISILFFDMLMCVQMIHAIFIIAFTFRTITEFHTRTVFICASADCTFMPSFYHLHFLGSLLKLLGSFLLLKTGRTCKGHPSKEDTDEDQAYNDLNLFDQSACNKGININSCLCHCDPACL